LAAQLRATAPPLVAGTIRSSRTVRRAGAQRPLHPSCPAARCSLSAPTSGAGDARLSGSASPLQTTVHPPATPPPRDCVVPLCAVEPPENPVPIGHLHMVPGSRGLVRRSGAAPTSYLTHGVERASTGSLLAALARRGARPMPRSCRRYVARMPALRRSKAR